MLTRGSPPSILLLCARSRPGQAGNAPASRAAFFGSFLAEQERTKEGICSQGNRGIFRCSRTGSYPTISGVKKPFSVLLCVPKEEPRKGTRNQPALRVPDPACPTSAAALPLFSDVGHLSRQSASGESRRGRLSTPLAGAPHGRGWRTDQRNMLTRGIHAPCPAGDLRSSKWLSCPFVRPFADRPGG